MKKLRMLLKLRAWLKSDTLKTGGLLGILGAAQVFFTSADGQKWIDIIAPILHLSSGTLAGLIIGVGGLATILHRAFTEWGLDEKLAGKDKT